MERRPAPGHLLLAEVGAFPQQTLHALEPPIARPLRHAGGVAGKLQLPKMVPDVEAVERTEAVEVLGA